MPIMITIILILTAEIIITMALINTILTMGATIAKTGKKEIVLCASAGNKIGAGKKIITIANKNTIAVNTKNKILNVTGIENKIVAKTSATAAIVSDAELNTSLSVGNINSEHQFLIKRLDNNIFSLFNINKGVKISKNCVFA